MQNSGVFWLGNLRRQDPRAQSKVLLVGIYLECSNYSGHVIARLNG